MNNLYKKLGIKYISIYAIYLYHVISSALIYAMPIFNGKLIDLLIEIKDKNKAIKFILILSIFIVGKIIIDYYLKNKISEYYSDCKFNFQHNILNKLSRIKFEEYNNYNKQTLFTQIREDGEILLNFLFYEVIDLLINISTIVLVIFTLYKIEKSFILIIGIICILYYLFYAGFKSQIKTLSIKSFKSRCELFDTQYEWIEYNKELRIKAKFKSVSLLLNNAYKSYRFLFIKLSKTNNLLLSFDGLFSYIFQLLILIVCIIKMESKGITIGQITIILSFYQIILNNIKHIFYFSKNFVYTKNAIDRTMKILNTNDLVDGQIVLNTIDTIELKNFNICFNQKCLFKENINYIFKKSNIYVISGRNGIGKTSLMNSILGLYEDAIQGDINFNNINSHNINKYSLREKLISSFIQNENIIECLYKSSLSKVIDLSVFEKHINLSNILEKNRYKLSGGEAQILALIHIFSENKEVLILDEPTSNLNKYLKEVILNYIQLNKEGKIIIIVTHDNNIINMADKVINLE